MVAVETLVVTAAVADAARLAAAAVVVELAQAVVVGLDSMIIVHEDRVPVVAEVVREELGGLVRGQSMAQYNEAFLEEHGGRSLTDAARAAMQEKLTARGGLGGIIALDPHGRPSTQVDPDERAAVRVGLHARLRRAVEAVVPTGPEPVDERSE